MPAHDRHDRSGYRHHVLARRTPHRPTLRRTPGFTTARAVACGEELGPSAVRHAELRLALARREFRLVYQPIVRLDTGTVVGAEALLRWEHPRLGLLRPAAFLDEAADAEVLPAIGEWMLGEAIAERGRWPDGTCVHLNLSPEELRTAVARGLPRRLQRTCRTADVAPDDVVIELTEQAITHHTETMSALALLAEVGARVALDDFGSGYATLARLHGFPFDVCKLDRSLVADMSDPASLDAVRKVVRIARLLGMDVVAEGVETLQQVHQLDAMGCELLQGHALCGPLSARAVRQLLDQRGRVMLDVAPHHRAAG